MPACCPHIKRAKRHTIRGNMHGSAGETCRPKRWLAGEKSEYKSTLPILVDTTDRRRTFCVRPTPLWWAAAREAIESFAEENKKTDWTRAHIPGPGHPDLTQGAASQVKKQTPVSLIKRKCCECPLAARTSRAPTDTRNKATCTGVLEILAAPKKGGWPVRKVNIKAPSPY